MGTDNDRTLAIMAAIFLATDRVCMYLDMIDDSVTGRNTGGGWARMTQEEAQDDARVILHNITRQGA